MSGGAFALEPITKRFCSWGYLYLRLEGGTVYNRVLVIHGKVCAIIELYVSGPIQLRV